MITALLIILEKILFMLMAIPVGYMLLFTLAAKFQRKTIGRSSNVSYIDKALQWCFPPRMLMMGVIALMTLAGLFINFIDFGRWFGLLALMTLCFYAGIPKEQRDAKLLKALGQIPQLIIITVKNMFHLGGTKDNFIHTEHNFDR